MSADTDGHEATPRVPSWRFSFSVGVPELVLWLSLTFVSVWPDLVGHAGVFAASADLVSTHITNPRVLFSVGMGLCALLFALAPRFVIRGDGARMLVVSLVGAVATVAFLWAVETVLDVRWALMISVVCALLVGFCHGWLMIRSLAQLAQLSGTGRIVAVCCASLLTKTALDQLVCLAPEVVQIACAVPMPVIVAALLVVSCRVGIGGGPGLTDLAELPKATGDLRRVALAVLVMNAVLHAVTRSVNTLGFWGSAYPLPQGVDASFVLVCVLLAGMAYLALVRVGGADLLTRYIPAFLMLLGGFFFLDERVIEALRMPDWLNGALSTWVELYAHTLYWVIGVHCVRSLDMHPLRSLGIAVLAMNVASIVVSLYLQWLTQVSGVVVMTVAYLFTALMVLVARGTKGGESMGLSDESLAEATHRSLEEIAMGAGLTSRETEVFILLSQGRDRSYIRDELFISEATIKTHCRHIYAKLGVANKQELISFVSGRSNR